LTSAPTDWTLALTFTGGGLGWPDATGDNTTNAPESNGLAIDAGGNIWTNANGQGVADFNAVIEFNNQGKPLSANLSGNFARGIGSVTGGYQNSATASVGKSDVVAIDQAAQVWIASSSEDVSYLAALDSEGMPTIQNTNGAYAAESSVQGLAIDKSGNLWEAYSSECDLQSYSGSDGAPKISETTCTGNTTLTNYDQLAFDPSGNVWVLSTQSAPDTGQVVELGAVDASPVDQLKAFSNGGQYSLAIDGSGNVFVPSTTSPGTITKQSQSSSSSSSYNYPLPSGAQGVSAVAIDGAGNVWGAAYSAAAGVTTTTPSYLVELSNSGSLLSPSGSGIYGFTGTGGGGETQPILSDYCLSGALSAPAFSGIAVDGSGNVWVTNSVVAPNLREGEPTHTPIGEQLVEFIGVATPAVTPTSVALTNNALGSKP
jgi:sugar lactone lactonase YvrE